MNRLEDSGEIELVVVAEAGGDFLDAAGGGIQQLTGMVHAQADKKVNRRAANLLFKEGKIVGGRDIGVGRQGGDLQRLVQMLGHIGDTAPDSPGDFGGEAA